MATVQKPVAFVLPSILGEVEPLNWGRDPMPPGPLGEWLPEHGFTNDGFQYIFAQDASTMNELMSSGSSAGKEMLQSNEAAFKSLTIAGKTQVSPDSGNNPFATLALGSRVPENAAPQVAAGSVGRRGRGRGRSGGSRALVPKRGGTVVASPIHGGGRFSFH
jgi:hypothetical protein